MSDEVDIDTTLAQVELLLVVLEADVLRHLRVRLRSFCAQNARITAVRVLREGPALVLEPPFRADAQSCSPSVAPASQTTSNSIWNYVRAVFCSWTEN